MLIYTKRPTLDATLLIMMGHDDKTYQCKFGRQSCDIYQISFFFPFWLDKSHFIWKMSWQWPYGAIATGSRMQKHGLGPGPSFSTFWDMTLLSCSLVLEECEKKAKRECKKKRKGNTEEHGLPCMSCDYRLLSYLRLYLHSYILLKQFCI